jgi:large subunit ribosomal protein L3
MKTILGTKGNMTQVFVNDRRVPVTAVTAGPCVVTQIRHNDVDGYWAIQFGLNTRPAKNTSKSLQGHFSKIQKDNKKPSTYPRNLVEVRTDKEPTYKVGDVVVASDIVKVGDVVSVSAVTKGKGFQGGMHRHGFHGGPKTHGQSDRWRAPGSIGQTTTPGRVYKGKKMAGRMGATVITIKNLHVISVDPQTNQIQISGAVPGRVGTILTIKRLSAGSLKDLEKEVATVVMESADAEAVADKGEAKQGGETANA